MELETIGLLDTWIESKGEESRVKQVQTTFDPCWVHEAAEPYVDASDVFSSNEDWEGLELVNDPRESG